MTTGWRERLLAAVDADPRPDRTISLAAGLGPNFINQLRHSNKQPGINNVLRLAEELQVSRSALFLGRDISADEEEFLTLLRSASDAQKSGLMLLLRGRVGRNISAEEEEFLTLLGSASDAQKAGLMLLLRGR